MIEKFPEDDITEEELNQLKLGIKLIQEMVELNSNISSQMWLASFLHIIAKSFANSGYSYADLSNHINLSFYELRHLFEEKK